MGQPQSPRAAPRLVCVSATSDVIRRLTAAGAVLAGVSAALSVVNATTMRRLTPPRTDAPESVAICIPARNEREKLPALLVDLRAQARCPDLEVFVLDDGSTDDTFALAERAVAADPRFELIRSDTDPPPGWTGKAAACRILAERAFDRGSVDYIAFVDADVRLDSHAVASVASALRSSGASLLCPWPRQLSGTLVESLVQPLLSFSWMSTLPIRAADASTRPSTVVACGQFMMFDANAYRSIGGHVSVAGSPTEDLDIARALRRQGRRTVLVAGGEFVRCRMYDGWPAVRDGYTRWLWNAFGGSFGSASVLGAISVIYLLPPAAALFGSGATRRWGLLGYCAAVSSRVAAGYAESGGSTPLLRTVARATAHPVSVAIYGALTIESFRRHRLGTTTWKGRPLTTEV